MCGAVSPLPNTISWRGAQFRKKAQGQIYLYLNKFSKNMQLKLEQFVCRM
jgi:hypothetical protein